MTLPRASILSTALAIAIAMYACRDEEMAPPVALLGIGLPPVAVAGGPYASTARVDFNGSLSFDPDGQTPLTYTWTFGDGSSGSGAQPSHTYAAAGVYTVTLIVRDAGGNNSLPSVTAATITAGAAPPAAPTNLTATAVGGTQIDLQWSDNASNEIGVRIERCAGAGCTTFAQIAQLPADATTHSNTGLSPSTTYRYRVRAFNDAGTSAYSNIAQATTAAPPPPPDANVLVGAGDIAVCSTPFDEATATLLDAIPGTVFTTGDNAYESGTAEEFTNCYGPSWGRHKARTRPSVGNHEYDTPGASGYYGYFGAAAGDPAKGYYSYDLGTWHIVVLNSNIAMHAGSPQEQWLRADLAASGRQCTAAYWHHARFSSGINHGSDPAVQPLWQALYDHGADVVMVGHDHLYERFAPQTPSGQADPVYGIRQFTVGTGGGGMYAAGPRVANSEAINTQAFGVLKLTLESGSYSWEFVPIAGQSYTDAGSGTCHGAPPPPPPPPTGTVLAAAGNIATCASNNDAATAQLLDNIPGIVVALGDNTVNGTAGDYQNCYEPTWGRHKQRTHTTFGNHDYFPGNADPTWDYFGDRAGPRGQGYHSFDVGAWHVIVLNDQSAHVAFGAGSAQEQWLAADLAANTQRCTIAIWHESRFLSSDSPGWTERSGHKILWDHLYAAGAEIVVNGQEHWYERMAPMRPDGIADPGQGIRQFNVGTGGESVGTAPTVSVHPNSVTRAAVFGVLKLTLDVDRYEWQFVSVGGAFNDQGSGTCH